MFGIAMGKLIRCKSANQAELRACVCVDKNGEEAPEENAIQIIKDIIYEGTIAPTWDHNKNSNASALSWRRGFCSCD